jgi:ABC-2 type transport system ATP-binding protein
VRVARLKAGATIGGSEVEVAIRRTNSALCPLLISALSIQNHLYLVQHPLAVPFSLCILEVPLLFVEVDKLTKQYRTALALKGVSLNVKQGEVLGLLGPNGAGKTTLLRILLGFLSPSSGTATVNNLNCATNSVAVRSCISYLPADARLFTYMRAIDLLNFYATVRPEGDIARAKQLAERLELNLKTWVAFMSTGMRQKLALAATLSCNAPLLILDEPTANLDPTVRSIVGEMVSEAKERGQTVMFSSHVLPEVEDVCDRVAIMSKGEVVHNLLIRDLRQHHRIRAVVAKPIPTPPEELRDQLVIRYEEGGTKLIIETPIELPKLFRWLSDLELTQVNIEPFGLRAIYDKYHAEAS